MPKYCTLISSSVTTFDEVLLAVSNDAVVLYIAGFTNIGAAKRSKQAVIEYVKREYPGHSNYYVNIYYQAKEKESV